MNIVAKHQVLHIQEYELLDLVDINTVAFGHRFWISFVQHVFVLQYCGEVHIVQVDDFGTIHLY